MITLWMLLSQGTFVYMVYRILKFIGDRI